MTIPRCLQAIAMQLKKTKPAFRAWRFGHKATRLRLTRICLPTVLKKRLKVGPVGYSNVEWNPLIQEKMDDADGHVALQPLPAD